MPLFPSHRRGGGNDGQRRERKFKDYLPRMAVIDTTEYGKDTVPDIDEDGLITYGDSPPKNFARPQSNSNKRRGRGGRIPRNNVEEERVNNGSTKQQYHNDNYSQVSRGRLSDDFPTPHESLQIRSNQDNSSCRTTKIAQENQHRESYPRDNRSRDYAHQDNRYTKDTSSHQEKRYRDRETNYQDNRSRDFTEQSSRYQDSRQYSNDVRHSNNYDDNRRGGNAHRGGRGRGGSSYRSQDVRQHEARMNEENWNEGKKYDNNRRDGRYRNDDGRYRSDDGRRNNYDDMNSSRSQRPSRDNIQKGFKSQDQSYSNNSRYQSGHVDNSGDANPVHQSGSDDYNNRSKKNSYRSYEQPPRYQQQQQVNREPQEFTKATFKMDDRSGDRAAILDTSKSAFNPTMTRTKHGDDVVKDLQSASVPQPASHVEKKSYAKERRAKGIQPGLKDRPANGINTADSNTGKLGFMWFHFCLLFVEDWKFIWR